jgi:acetylornithine deacetylase/succinyl-diaminopimelate desuccinylase-like protein
MLEAALRRARAGREAAERDLFELLTIPSVSGAAEHRGDCERAAGWLLERFRGMGMDAMLSPGDGRGGPLVAAEWMGRPHGPVLTLYGHYDVHSADPAGEWRTPPFEPTVRDGHVYARGASDDKGQLLAAIKAAEHAFATGTPAVNLRFLIEGEKEVTGTSLARFVRDHAEDLASDVVLVCDGRFLAPDMPALRTALRGMLAVEIEVIGPRADVHAGYYGGIAPNPLHSLAAIVAGLKDRDGTVRIPGFYHDVRPPNGEEMGAWRELDWLVDQKRREIGAVALAGEPAFAPLERNWARPTLDVHGMVGGCSSGGHKTVIPSRALGKLSMRLVPDQDPARILIGLKELVAQLALPGTRARVTETGRAPAVRVVANDGLTVAATRAFKAAFGAGPVLIRDGDTILVARELQRSLGSPMLVTGFGLPDDAPHSANERFSLEQYHRGTEMVMHLMNELARASR